MLHTFGRGLYLKQNRMLDKTQCRLSLHSPSLGDNSKDITDNINKVNVMLLF